MSRSFQESFCDFVFDRTFKLAADAAAKDPRNVKYSREIGHLMGKIMELLGDDKDLVMELESTNSLREIIEVEYAYRQGLKDGIQLRQEIRLTN